MALSFGREEELGTFAASATAATNGKKRFMDCESKASFSQGEHHGWNTITFAIRLSCSLFLAECKAQKVNKQQRL